MLNGMILSRVVGIALICPLSALGFGQAGRGFKVAFSGGKLTSLQSPQDPHATDFVAKGAGLGDVQATFRISNGPWQSPAAEQLTQIGDGQGAEWRLGTALATRSWFEIKGDRLLWHFRVSNQTDKPVEVGSLSTPLPMRTRFDQEAKTSVLKHSFVSGAGSFLFWMRRDSAAPYLTMLPLKGTAPEYWRSGRPDGYRIFLHSSAEAADIAAHNGTWRLPHTSLTLKPHGSAEYGYSFQWAKSYEEIRDLLAESGGLDVQVAPGMTAPSDLYAQFALRSARKVDGVDCEFPKDTDVRRVGRRNGYDLYQVKFRRLGENRLTVRQGDAKTYLEFFACQPVETLIKKRAAFLTKAQVQNDALWYDGLFRERNLKGGTYLDPDHYDNIKGWRIYEVTCDDPGLAKPAYIASKNAEFPVQAEVTALDRYISKFVWGGLQQTTQELYPYSIYGIPDWKTLRASTEKDRTKGVDHVWRCYDYPHIILMYYAMYRIASQHPEIKTALRPAEYLDRAYGTANAMFTVPDKIVHWSAYGTGYYNEIVIPSLIADLRRNGRTREADRMTAFWSRKVREFVVNSVDLFASEYAFDSTGFESTQVLADLAMRDGAALGIPAEKARRFMDEQMSANIFCRGFIEPAYYLLGSDYRGGGGDGYTLSYMAPMGGTSVLDYGLHYAKDPAPYLRSGFQSILSSWALMNAGTPDSSFGYWFPGGENDGGTGGGFEPASYGETWLGQPHGRGAWYYSCETDLGYCGYLRAARTLVSDDPIFGRFCFAGVGHQTGKEYRFIPHDGVRRRISLRIRGVNLDAEIEGGHFSATEAAIATNTALRAKLDPHTVVAFLTVSGAKVVRLGGKTLQPVAGRFEIPASARPQALTMAF